MYASYQVASTNISRVEFRWAMNINRTILIIRNTTRKKSLSSNMVGKNARKLEIRNGITRKMIATNIVLK